MSGDNPLRMTFEPRTIEHLGVRMYSTLPPALAELISNSYDADAECIIVSLSSEAGHPKSITVKDDGCGMSLEELNAKFLTIGRNRREDDNDDVSEVFSRKATGKKGLGKLALFGLAKTIDITTVKDGRKNKFSMNWDKLMQTQGTYQPDWVIQNEKTEEFSGTSICLYELKRKSPFDIHALAKSLALIFIFDDHFNLILKDTSGTAIAIDNSKKYEDLDEEFFWTHEDWKSVSSQYFHVTGKIISTRKPISPKSGLRGITLYSRGKLVNAPDFFAESTSSHFFQYVTGYIKADFIDEFPEDLISTNRQAIDWEHPEMKRFQEFLQKVIAYIKKQWRDARKKKKEGDITGPSIGFDKDEWLATLPDEVRNPIKGILNTLTEEDGIGDIAPIAKALHDIAPEYPHLHWRHLHKELRRGVEEFYKNKQYGVAAHQGCDVYLGRLRDLTGRTDDAMSLVNPLFSLRDKKDPKCLPVVQITDLKDDIEKNIQEGQAHLSKGLVTGFRNPTHHREVAKVVPKVFSELDCLNILSLTSYLMERVEGAKVNKPEEKKE